MLAAVSDDRSFLGFGRKPAESCAYAKTFARFNTALSPVEWRLRNGKPFATIQRWRVSTDDEGGSVTWLVVTALKGGEACHVHSVAGSNPEANVQARRAADELVPDFDCESDVPTIDSRVGTEGIDVIACQQIADRRPQAALSASFARLTRFRSCGSRIAFLRRIDFGVTSTSSSSPT